MIMGCDNRSLHYFSVSYDNIDKSWAKIKVLSSKDRRET